MVKAVAFTQLTEGAFLNVQSAHAYLIYHNTYYAPQGRRSGRRLDWRLRAWMDLYARSFRRSTHWPCCRLFQAPMTWSAEIASIDGVP